MLSAMVPMYRVACRTFRPDGGGDRTFPIIDASKPCNVRGGLAETTYLMPPSLTPLPLPVGAMEQNASVGLKPVEGGWRPASWDARSTAPK